jgi:hypothetical protein
MPKNKPWEQPLFGRAPAATRERRRVLIVCEDGKSSRYYFESFPVDKQRIEISVLGTGMNTDSLVEEAVRKTEQAERNGRRYSDVWCVFDRDSFPLGNYTRAFQLAENKKIKATWANEAFELWYLLHYCYLDAGISRADYKEKLREKGLDYDKADKAIYEKVKPLQERAIKNAARQEKHWNDSGKVCPERENPSTSVHKLVEYLNQLADLGSVD